MVYAFALRLFLLGLFKAHEVSKSRPMLCSVHYVVDIRSTKVFKPREHFHSEDFKTKFAFIGGQFMYTIVTMVFVPTVFRSFWVHTGYALLVLLVAVWNAGGYYVHVSIYICFH